METNKKTIRKFKLTELAVNNSTTVLILAISVLVFGFLAYRYMPKELFPEGNYPTIFVQTVYPGNSPKEIENLITKPLEKELKSIENLNRLKSTSAQDVSMLFLEFKPNVDLDEIMPDVKDAVDRVKADLPDDLPSDPQVIEFNFADFPIMMLNISGDYSIDELEKIAETLKDAIEAIPEISNVKIQGIEDKEVQVNADLRKMQQLHISFQQIENAIKSENLTVSAGEIHSKDLLRSVRVVGEFKDVDDIKNIIVASFGDKNIYLKDIAEVKFTYKDPESIARMDGKPVVTLQVVKKSGENLISAAQNVFNTIDKLKEDGEIPKNLVITITNEQSTIVKRMINNLENNMTMGIILVVFVLFLFLGLRNASLVGLAIPMSMYITYIVLALMGETINMISFFALILALGMLVDNAIVVTENIYRFVDNGIPLKKASLLATSEIAIPITTSTLTTLAAFLPLLFWNSLSGMFMRLLPKTLIIVLTASLFTALVITPVLSRWFVKSASLIHKPHAKKALLWSAVIFVISTPFYALRKFTVANLLLTASLLILLYTFVLFDLSKWFQNKFLPWLEEIYLKFIKFSLKGKNPQIFFFGTIILLIFSYIFYFKYTTPEITFFPKTDPRYLNVFVELPTGSTLEKTDSVMRIVEKDVNEFLKPYDDIIESKLITVGNGVRREREVKVGKTYNKAMMTITFVDYEYRHGKSTAELQRKLSLFVKNRYPGVNIYIERDPHGPAVGKPINLELSGPDIEKLIELGDKIIAKIDSAHIPGIEKLAMDIEIGRPEILITPDRDKIRSLGLSTAQVAMAIRTSIYGSEASKFKTPDDEYPINVRLAKQYRNNIYSVLNQNLTLLTKQGKIISVPISSLVKISYETGYDAIKHIDTKRTITIYSNVIEGYNANAINKIIASELKKMPLPHGYEIKFTGEQKSMKESMQFMILAMAIAVILIFTILITQFNSFVKPVIILASVVFSTIGVFLGLGIFNMDIVIIMTGIGIIALAGIVVNNAIVLIDYIDLLKKRRKEELNIDPDDNLPENEIKDQIVEAGRTRLRPVLLTAITTILGLFPMALGININFNTLFSEFNPHFYTGGDNAAFWSPLALSIIFGLTVATFLTLIIVPVMYWLANKVKLKLAKK